MQSLDSDGDYYASPYQNLIIPTNNYFDDLYKDYKIERVRASRRINSVASKRGDIFDRWVFKNLQPLLVEDVKKDFRFDIEKIDQDETRLMTSLISTPLLMGGKVLGVL